MSDKRHGTFIVNIYIEGWIVPMELYTSATMSTILQGVSIIEYKK